MYLFVYLAIALDCTYPVLRVIMHYIIARHPRRWLTNAVKNGDLEIVKCASARFRDPKSINWDSYMTMAAYYGHLHIIQYAASQGAGDWNWCMSGAACYGFLHIVEYVAYQGATDWNWCMVQAAHGGHLAIVQYAAARGDSKAMDWDGCIAWAVKRGHHDIVEFLQQCKSRASQNEN